MTCSRVFAMDQACSYDFTTGKHGRYAEGNGAWKGYSSENFRFFYRNVTTWCIFVHCARPASHPGVSVGQMCICITQGINIENV